MAIDSTAPESSTADSGVTLALAGGGLRALAHLGVLQVLEREGIAVRAVAGTSMGGLLGALLAAGMPLATIEREIAGLLAWRRLLRLIDLRLGRWGLVLRGARVHALLARLLADRQFADLGLPLAVVASDLESGCAVVLRAGAVADAVRATISVPGVFEPFVSGRLRLVDGGLLDNLPVGAARALGPWPVVAVDVLPHFRANTPGGERVVPPLRAAYAPRRLRDALHRTMMMIAESTALRLALEPPALLLRPAVPSEVTLLFGKNRTGEIIAAGRAAAAAQLPRLRELARVPPGASRAKNDA